MADGMSTLMSHQSSVDVIIYIDKLNSVPPSVQPDRTAIGARGCALGTEGIDVIQDGTRLGFISGKGRYCNRPGRPFGFPVRLGPLNGAKHDEAGKPGWDNAIGFNQSPVLYREATTGVSRNNFKALLASFRIWGRDMKPLNKLPTPTS